MPDRRRYARTPDTILILAACALVGGFLTATGHVPVSVLALVSPGWGLAWSALFTISATASLVGVFWRDALTGWTLELGGRLGLTFTAAGYVVSLTFSMTKPGTALVIGIVAGISLASGWRVYQLTRRLVAFQASLARRGES